MHNNIEEKLPLYLHCIWQRVRKHLVLGDAIWLFVDND